MRVGYLLFDGAVFSIPGRGNNLFSKQYIYHRFIFFTSQCFISPPLPEGRAGIAWETSKPLFPCSRDNVCHSSSTPFFFISFILSFFFHFFLPYAFQSSSYFQPFKAETYLCYTGWRKKNACFSNNCNFVYFQCKKIMSTPKQPVINAVLIT